MNPVGHVDFTAEMLAATECERGDLLVYDSTSGYWEVATTAARGTKRSEAIALTAYGGSMVGKVQYQAAGIVAASISGLGSGVAISSAASWVRCSSTGTMERCTPADGDDIIGRAEADGRVHLMFGILTDVIIAGGGGATPGGSTGSIQANDGAGGLTGYSTVLLGSGFWSVGSDPSTFGAIRLDNNPSNVNPTAGIWARDDGDAANMFLIGAVLDEITIGDGSWDIRIDAGTDQVTTAAGTHSLEDDIGTELLNVTSARALFKVVPYMAPSAMGALLIDWAVSNVFTKTLAAGANAISFDNDTDGELIAVVLTGAASTVTWDVSPSVLWAGGVAPTQTASGTDVYTFIKAGGVIYGSVVQDMS